MSLEGVLLGLLRKPLSGYEVKQSFDTVFSHIWAAKLSQIYRTLKALEDEGCLKSRSQPSPIGPERRVYEITPKGRRRLHDWLATEPVIDADRNAHVAQLYFMGELGDPHRTLSFLHRLREHFQRRLAALQASESGWRTADPRYPDRLPDDAFHTHLTLTMGLQVAQARLHWVDESIRRIQKRLAGGPS